MFLFGAPVTRSLISVGGVGRGLPSRAGSDLHGVLRAARAVHAGPRRGREEPRARPARSRNSRRENRRAEKLEGFPLSGGPGEFPSPGNANWARDGCNMFFFAVFMKLSSLLSASLENFWELLGPSFFHASIPDVYMNAQINCLTHGLLEPVIYPDVFQGGLRGVGRTGP